MTPNKHDEFEHEVKRDVEARVREGVKAILEEVLQKEMAEHLEAGYRELTPTPGEESATATTSATSSHQRERSSAWRSPEIARASS